MASWRRYSAVLAAVALSSAPLLALLALVAAGDAVDAAEERARAAASVTGKSLKPIMSRELLVRSDAYAADGADGVDGGDVGEVGVVAGS